MYRTLIKKRNTTVIREIIPNDFNQICSWIQNPNILSLVSGDKGDKLTIDILTKWIDTAIRTIVITDKNNNPIGFCTITINELEIIKNKYIELCHLIINPDYKNKLEVGEMLSNSACDYSNTLGFDYIIGRVMPSNRFGNFLAKNNNWKALNKQLTAPAYFNWYIKKLNIK